MMQTLLWIVTGSLIGVVLVLLLLPTTRRALQALLKRVDGMSMAHSPPDFSAVRRIRTVLGGFFTVASVLVALALSSNLVVDFATANTARSDGLQVAAKGFAGTARARAATSDIVLDVVIRPASFAGCTDGFEPHTVSEGSTTASWTPGAAGAGATHASSGTLLELVATAAATKLADDADSTDISASGGAVCWLRATCSGCSLSRAATVRVTSHWSAQVMAWRLATVDAEGDWVSAEAVAASPAAALLGAGGADTANVTASAGLMLDVQSESVALVGHVLDDERVTPAKAVDAFITQDLAQGVPTTRSVQGISPEVSSTALSLTVQPSTVFATTKLTTVYTFTQLVSAIVGVVIGIMGAFTAGFATFEKTLGPRLECLCSRTGLVETEAEAMELAREELRAASRGRGGGDGSKLHRPSMIASASGSGEALSAARGTNPLHSSKRAASAGGKAKA